MSELSCTAAGTSEGFATSQLRIDDGTLHGYMLIYGSRATAGAAAPKQTGSAVRQLTIAAGASVTATLRINAELALGIGTVTATWENASLRLTAIKR